MLISFMHILVPSHNGFILILIFDIPNEPLGIIILDTRETLRTRCHISINGPAYTNYHSRRSYMMLLTQAVQ
ncbi:hypothetical protein F383_33886 [Gossypium arboreum]|uniref:Uncharacterized protein n=1 Tax=Gossypium arboreum TaxID=29729 RepID=A0A0B0N5U6_GOSAR|nr:hypothetical protein F383_33886 [Gossypium arboreum]